MSGQHGVQDKKRLTMSHSASWIGFPMSVVSSLAKSVFFSLTCSAATLAGISGSKDASKAHGMYGMHCRSGELFDRQNE